ncbi:MAG: hypothetical protein ACKVQS_00390 [Fimbriimonadaceae bacterium]
MESSAGAKWDWWRIARYFLILVGVPAVGYFGLCIAPSIPGWFKLGDYKRAYRAIKHPTDSRPVKQFATYGILNGSSNHCDYFAGELRASRLPTKEIVSFYAGQTVSVSSVFEVWRSQVPEVNFDSGHDPLFEDFGGMYKATWNWMRSDEIGSAGNDLAMFRSQLKPGERLYWISLGHAGDDPGLDWNCN